MTAAAPTTRRSAVVSVLLAVGVLAGVTAAALASLSVVEALTATGLPDPALLTKIHSGTC